MKPLKIKGLQGINDEFKAITLSKRQGDF